MWIEFPMVNIKLQYHALFIFICLAVSRPATACTEVEDFVFFFFPLSCWIMLWSHRLLLSNEDHFYWWLLSNENLVSLLLLFSTYLEAFFWINWKIHLQEHINLLMTCMHHLRLLKLTSQSLYGKDRPKKLL